MNTIIINNAPENAETLAIMAKNQAARNKELLLVGGAMTACALSDHPIAAIAVGVGYILYRFRTTAGLI